MEKITIQARVLPVGDGYLAEIDGLDVVGRGGTAKEAQDDLVEKFLSCLQTWEGQSSLASVLASAGYSGVGEDTELELEFSE